MAGTVKENPKLQALREKQTELQKRIAEIEAREKAKSRKDDTRLKIIVGAAIIANIKLHPETRAAVVAVLHKAVTAPRDVEFLKVKGWL